MNRLGSFTVRWPCTCPLILGAHFRACLGGPCSLALFLLTRPRPGYPLLLLAALRGIRYYPSRWVTFNTMGIL